jgi:hypothetical protein
VITREVKRAAPNTIKLIRNASPENRRLHCHPCSFPIGSPQIPLVEESDIGRPILMHDLFHP